jgi:uncharacterized membrane protein YgaE (UPF0421/DUF939 family)
MLGTFFTISTTDIATMIGYSGDLFADFSPILLIVVGVGVGIFVITAIIGAIRGH